MSDKEVLLMFIPDSAALDLNDIPCFLDDDPTKPFVIGLLCESCIYSCDDKCFACSGTGYIEYYFNSEPTEPNVIGINERMVNN